MDEKHLISVIIPTYNRANTIKRSVQSVLQQTYRNIEVVVVDDASADDTYEILNSMKDKRIKYIKNEKNMGPAASRNKGVSIARGDMIAFQDSDDEWLDNKLEKQVEKIRSSKEFVMVYCPYLHFGKKSIQQIPADNTPIQELEGNIYQSLLKSNKIGTPTILIKKEIFEDIGGFDEDMYAYEDWDFAIRVSQKYRIGYVDEALVNAYYSDNSVNNNYFNLANGTISILRKNFDRVPDYSMLKRLIQLLLEYSINSGMEYSEFLVPKVIHSRMEYGLLMEAYEKEIIWKKKYEVLSWLEDCAIPYFQKINHPIVVYGAGVLGKKLVKILKSMDKSIQYIIDRREKDQSGNKVINLADFLKIGGEGICVITVYDADRQIKKEIQKNFNGEIINLFEII